MKFSAVILAGGKSQRMGRDKAMLLFEAKPLLARQIEIAREAGAAEIFISGRAGTDYSAFGCPVLTDRFENAGPLAGVERGLAEISSPLLLALAVDMPGMTGVQLQKILAHCTENRGAVPRVAGEIQPLAAYYPKTALSIATRSLETGRFAVRQFAGLCVEERLADFAELPIDCSQYFENWNAPADVRFM